ESELFGYEKGAFSGAAKTTPGKIELAHKGTLMLDEIGDLPFSLQSKLLRFLQERVIERVGGRQEIPIDVRVVCATHQNLKTLIGEGRFREDLYYRLAEIVIMIPPLRERIGDAALLAHALVRRFASEQNRGSLSLSEEAVRAISAYSWPGNVRELENCLKRATIMAEGNSLSVQDVGLGETLEENMMPLDLRTIRDAAERKAIIAAVSRSNGNLARAADLLGISRPTLYDLMHKFGLKT
ncbi:MAG: sigma 54-interacting transcriptional regulator, partial [Rugosibacter sp.]|nr:sigma 54-interacting transcriptional regulator [Rugosibacter sp.]